VLGGIMGQKHQIAQQGDVDQDHLVQQHQSFFGGGGGSPDASSSNIGVRFLGPLLVDRVGGARGLTES
jgi:hypothetical protein